jgi:vacuolar-type H+-ATPase subunit F/Vma7
LPKVVAVARSRIALALGLAGIRVREPADTTEAEEAIVSLLDSDAELLIVQEDLRAHFSDELVLALSRHRGRPLVVYCPSFEQEESEVDAYLASVLKPAVGYEIRLE